MHNLDNAVKSVLLKMQNWMLAAGAGTLPKVARVAPVGYDQGHAVAHVLVSDLELWFQGKKGTMITFSGDQVWIPAGHEWR